MQLAALLCCLVASITEQVQGSLMSRIGLRLGAAHIQHHR